MARSSWKFYYVGKYFFKKIFLKKFRKIRLKVIYCRSTVVTNILKNRIAYLYKGDEIIRTRLSKFSVGFKLGEFAISRKPFSFPIKKKKKKR